MSEQGRSRTLLWIVIGGGAFFLFVLAVFTLVYLTMHAGDQSASIHSFGDKIGVIDLEGLIHDGLLQGSPPVAGLLGAETLRRHHGIIDFGTRTLYLR